MIIQAQIIGSDQCTAEGFTVRSAAPVLAMCRKLIEAGYDPAAELHAYRGDMLCLKISSIAYGARYTVKDGRTGRPSLRRFQKPPRRVSTAPPAGDLDEEAQDMPEASNDEPAKEQQSNWKSAAE
jgi:hypothetical protein